MSLAKTVMVYTENTLADCIERGGVGWWTIGERTVPKVRYAIATVKGGIDDKTAKFVIKVKGHLRHPDPTENRVMLTFDEYALVDIPKAWPGHRNPVTYVLDDDLATLGIDLASLNWESVPVGTDKQILVSHRSHDNIMEHFDKLTIQQIKEGLARRLQVTADAIEIYVKA
jgi:hypothetical protein